MSFIDEAAREINVKIVWYSAAPGTAAALVRHVGDRTRPDLKRQEALAIDGGMVVTHLQFVPAGLGAIRGFSVRFHLYAIEAPAGRIETADARFLVFRGADACVFIGGPDEAAALARVDAVFASQGYSDIPIVCLAESGGGADLGFPASDVFALDANSGAGIFDGFKAIAKKLLATLAGRPPASRPTPPPGTATVPPPAVERVAMTLEETQAGLDEWQRAYHAKAIWVVGYEQTRLTPSDIPPGAPPHIVHVIRPTSSDGFAVMTNGFSREAPAPGAERLELRADTSRHGWQIAQALSLLGRLAIAQARAGRAPWLAFDLVTTAEEPLFGIKHFVLMPGGSVRVNEQPVTILRAAPITPEEHHEVSGKITGDARAGWLAARGATMLDRWLPALQRERPFSDR
jgi:hypothetical protein